MGAMAVEGAIISTASQVFSSCATRSLPPAHRDYAVGVMLLLSKPLTAFVGKHPTVVILCLGFLLMIGFSLIIEGFGVHLPKGYLYAAIGFSVTIEALNQLARHNREGEAFIAGDLAFEAVKFEGRDIDKVRIRHVEDVA